MIAGVVAVLPVCGVCYNNNKKKNNKKNNNSKDNNINKKTIKKTY